MSGRIAYRLLKRKSAVWAGVELEATLTFLAPAKMCSKNRQLGFIEGWASVKNRKLLALIEEAGFNAFITADKNLEAQQSLQGRPFAILLLSTNHWPSIRPQVSKISEALHTCEPGSVTKVDCGAFTPRRMMKPKSPSS